MGGVMGQCKMGVYVERVRLIGKSQKAIPVVLLVAPQDTRVTLILALAKIKFPHWEEFNGSAQKQQSDCDSAGSLQI